MKTKIFLVILLLSTMFGGISFAGYLAPASQKALDVSNADKSPIIEKTGSGFHVLPPGLEKRIFIHYVKPGLCGNNVCDPGENADKCPQDCGSIDPVSTCYETLGNGLIWKTLPINYVINPINGDGLSQVQIESIFANSFNTWDLSTQANLTGNSTIDYTADWDGNYPDGRNELVFDNYPEANVIGVTVIWGYNLGAPKNRKITEFDILFNDFYDWGDASVNSSLMDLENIATHELGHGLGLGDLYTTTCNQETMFGYSDYGETSKRDLNPGDIAGIQYLYGN